MQNEQVYFVSFINMKIGDESLKVRIEAEHGQEVDVDEEHVRGCHLS